MSKKVNQVIDQELFPEAALQENDTMLDEEVVFEDVVFLTGKYGKYAVVKYQYDEGSDEHFSTALGFKVVKDKLKEIKEKDAFPVQGKVIKVEPEEGEYEYYDLV